MYVLVTEDYDSMNTLHEMALCYTMMAGLALCHKWCLLLKSPWAAAI